MARRIDLTSGADAILPDDDDLTVAGTQQTLNPNDSLEGGGGFDTLALTGSGTFDLTNLLRFTGFEAVSLTNETGTAATLMLANTTSATVTLGRGASTATTDANGNSLINVYLGTGRNTIYGGSENDTFSVSAPANIHAGDVISGGGGTDTLALLSSPGRYSSTSYDISGVTLSQISTLVIGNAYLGSARVRVNSTTLTNIDRIGGLTVGGYNSATIITSDSDLYIGNLQFAAPQATLGSTILTITSDNQSGTTFRVNGTAQADVVRGGAGNDTLLSQTVLPFATREAILDRSIETVTDPSGSYQHLVRITTSDASINTTRPVVSGTVDASATGTVSVYNSSTLVGTAAIQADHTWTTTANLGQDGNYTLQARASDAAGDVGSSNLLQLTIDTSPPVVSITTQGGDVTNRYVTLSGSAVTQTANGVNVSGEAGATVQVYEGTALLGSARVDSTGHWSAGIALGGAGSHTLVAVETDAAGNVGRSNAVTFNALAAGSGNDTVTAGPGVNILDGGAGDDTVVLNFALTQTSVNYDAVGHTVLDGPNGAHEVLSNFEHYRFTDGTVNEHAGSALVDDLFYFGHNLDVWNAHVDATAHYNANGWHEGRDPSAYFSTSGYLAANADVRAAGVNPLTHYDSNGWHEGRDPSAAFDNELYLARNPDVARAGIDPLAHYLANGQAEGRQAYAAIGRGGDIAAAHGFDAEYYLLNNADVARAAINAGGDSFAFAYQHYETYGWHEGRNPNAVFDVTGYLNAYADVRAANVDPLAHYDSNGWREGRDPSASFDTRAYESHYADVAQAGIDPLTHYLTNGIYEGRSAYGDGHFG